MTPLRGKGVPEMNGLPMCARPFSEPLGDRERKAKKLFLARSLLHSSDPSIISTQFGRVPGIVPGGPVAIRLVPDQSAVVYLQEIF